jgi:hypothetical protein
VSFDREAASIPTSSSALKIDGRRLRSERTRLAIIEAYLELLRRYSVMPTAAQLADEAGCSVRSIFGRFSDLNALSLATADYAIVQGQAEAVARDFNGDRPTRIRSHVKTRALACGRGWPRRPALNFHRDNGAADFHGSADLARHFRGVAPRRNRLAVPHIRPHTFAR